MPLVFEISKKNCGIVTKTMITVQNRWFLPTQRTKGLQKKDERMNISYTLIKEKSEKGSHYDEFR